MNTDKETVGRVEEIRTRLSGEYSQKENLTNKEVRQLIGNENIEKIWKEIERQIPRLHIDIKSPWEWRLISVCIGLQIITNIALITFIILKL
ncbi:MAG: hypothetical protein CBC47_01650 [Alphaproteobacteria bacterium TMED87]|nr:hypothetical protein [Rhodospirillaceae bacterium]OUV11227.1 MAG: hypothetical protein CBC47_01650 [Alphaproteobacteria bacterium TMED87]|tara:strand:+ start:234 stop:509 length:276 start_codon:yes stop_codon:yes gene_type:complete